MQRSTNIWCAFFASAILFLSGCKNNDATAEMQPLKAEQAEAKSSLRRELEFTARTNLLSTAYLPDYSSNEFHYVQHSFADTLISMIDPELLKKYEGSYTDEELRERGDEPTVYNLRTSWFTVSEAPSVGIHVILNPITGQYEIRGGDLYLPKSGFGMSYDENKTTGESETFFNWKREF
jgi:hypothetical protein